MKNSKKKLIAPEMKKLKISVSPTPGTSFGGLEASKQPQT